MKFAIIAAGDGSRLAQEGITVPKPLVPLNGIPMVERLIRLFMENGANEIVVIANETQTATAQLLRKLQRTYPLHIVIKTTPSSMHSFYELSPYLQDDIFCMTTVDTVFKPKEFSDYITAFKASTDDGLLATTSYIDDEKPLYVAVNEESYITGFHDTKNNCRFISGGIYGLKPNSIPVLQRCISQGLSRMRNFQRELVSEGLHLKAYPFSKILDVDHAQDIQKAESFLNEEGAK